MNPELDRLLKAWEAFLEAKRGVDAERLHQIYWDLAYTIAGQSGVSREILHKAILKRYPAWKRANEAKFPTLPPEA